MVYQNYNVYLRAKDTKLSFTALSNYTLDTFTKQPPIITSGAWIQFPAPAHIVPIVPLVEVVPVAPEVISPKTFVFSNNLQLNSVHRDVKELQKYLNTHGYPIALKGIGSAGNETTKFGSFTKKALIKFQLAHKLSPAIGFFGPATRRVVNTSFSN